MPAFFARDCAATAFLVRLLPEELDVMSLELRVK